MSGPDGHLSGLLSAGLPVILTELTNKPPETKQQDLIFLLVRLVRSSLYYLVIFNILTGQIREETETIFNDVHTRSSC